MDKCFIRYFKNCSLIFVIAFLVLQSCADLSTEPNQNINPAQSKIQITSPSSNSIISAGRNNIYYNIGQPYSIKFIELYINDTFKKNIPPNSDGTPPPVSFDLDSTYIGDALSLFLIYYDNDGTSHKSNTIIKLVVTEDNSLPFKPYNLSIIKFNDGSCNISWKDSSRIVEKYELWRKIDFSGEFILNQEILGNSFNTNDYGLDTSKIYFYKLRGVKSSGFSEFSDEVNTAGIITSGNLYPPSNLTAAVSGQSVVILNWNDNSDNENYFTVERSANNFNFQKIASISRNTTTFKDSGNGLLLGATYNYRIKAFSNSDSAMSNTATISINSNFLLPPSNLTANYNSNIGVIELNWINNDNNILYIDIERKTETGNFTLLRRIDSENNLYLDFNIIQNQIYTYRIRGYNLITYSNYSNLVTISTL